MNKDLCEKQETTFEKDIIFYYKNQISHVTAVNSPSSANLMAMLTITDPVFGSRQAKYGDEIITTVSGHPSITNSILQSGLCPVYVDVDLETFHPNFEIIEQAITKDIRGIVLGHSFGNPYDIEILRDICDEYGIWMIEDCLDAFGASSHGNLVGSCGDISTLNMGFGVCITNSPMVHKVLKSFANNGTFPEDPIIHRIGYDVKIAPTLFAENLNNTQQCWDKLFLGTQKYKKYFHFMKPASNAIPFWSHFVMIVKETAPFTKEQFKTYLIDHNIDLRCSFYGNILNYPAYKNINCRIIGTLFNSDVIDRDSVFINCNIKDKKSDYLLTCIEKFMRKWENT